MLKNAMRVQLMVKEICVCSQHVYAVIITMLIFIPLQQRSLKYFSSKFLKILNPFKRLSMNILLTYHSFKKY